jgi:hypothetical protein
MFPRIFSVIALCKRAGAADTLIGRLTIEDSFSTQIRFRRIEQRHHRPQKHRFGKDLSPQKQDRSGDVGTI